MSELILEWQEDDRVKSQSIRDRQPSKNPGTVRIGRDPLRCDILLNNPTVSGLHIEILFSRDRFILRSLRPSNPPIVDGYSLPAGEVPLNPGSTIQLGDMMLKVAAIITPQPLASCPPTVLTARPPASTPPPATAYGLECPHCHRVSSYERLELGCPWCGTSLAAAASIVVPPGQSLP